MSMQSEAGSGLTERQRWADIARGMQQDLAAYAGLRDLLQTQFHAALRHDAAAMEEVARQIAAQVQQLDGIVHGRKVIMPQRPCIRHAGNYRVAGCYLP